MSENHHNLTAGKDGVWLVGHYRTEIDKGVTEGKPREYTEALHRKLARAIAQFGDPENPNDPITQARKAKERETHNRNLEEAIDMGHEDCEFCESARAHTKKGKRK